MNPLLFINKNNMSLRALSLSTKSITSHDPLDESIVPMRNCRPTRIHPSLTSPLKPTTGESSKNISGAQDMSSPSLPSFPKYGVTIELLRKIKDIVHAQDPSLTTTDVCENFVKIWTQASSLSLAELFLKEYRNKKHPVLEMKSKDAIGQTATIFISHAWKYTFVELIDAIDTFYLQNVNTAESKMYFWVDLCVNSQWKTSSLPFEWWSTTFQSAIGSIGHTCLILSPWDAPVPLTRAWCLWEILCTRRTNSKLTLQFSSDQLKAYQNTLMNDFDHIMKSFCQIDVQNSECYFESDKLKIFNSVQLYDGGFRGVNLQINGAIREWLVESGREALAELTNNNNNQPNDENANERLLMTSSLARLLKDHGNYDESETLLINALSECQTTLGRNHPTSLCILSTLATLLTEQGRYEEAEKMNHIALEGLQSCTDEGQEDQLSNSLSTLGNLAALYSKQGRLEEAEATYRKALQGEEAANHTNTITFFGMCNNFATVLADTGKYEEAKVLYQRALKGYEKEFGTEHPLTLGTINNIANLFTKTNEFNEAEVMYHKALIGQEKVLGVDHPDVLGTVNNLGKLASSQGKTEEAVSLYKRALIGLDRTLGVEHPDATSTANNLAVVLIQQKKYQEAEVLLLRVLNSVIRIHGEEHMKTLSALRGLAFVKKQSNQILEALELFTRELGIAEKMLPPDHPDIYRSALDVAIIHQNLGEFEIAEVELRKIFLFRRSTLGMGHRDTLRVAYYLASVLFELKSYDEAKYLAEATYVGFVELTSSETSPDSLASKRLSDLCDRVIHDRDNNNNKKRRGSAEGNNATTAGRVSTTTTHHTTTGDSSKIADAAVLMTGGVKSTHVKISKVVPAVTSDSPLDKITKASTNLEKSKKNNNNNKNKSKESNKPKKLK